MPGNLRKKVIKVVLIIAINLQAIVQAGALSPAPASMDGYKKVSILADSIRNKYRINYAFEEKEKNELKKNCSTSRYDSDRQGYILEPEIEGDDLELVRAIINANVCGFMKQLKQDDPFKYFNIRDNIYGDLHILSKYWELDDGKQLRIDWHNNEETKLVDNIVAKAVELAFIKKEKLLPYGRDNEEYRNFYENIFEVIEDNGGYELFKSVIFVSPLQQNHRKFNNENSYIEKIRQQLFYEDKIKIGDIFNSAQLKDKDIEIVREIIKKRYLVGEAERNKDIANAVEVAHLLFLNPTIRVKEIAKRLKINLKDIRKSNEIIRKVPLFFDIFLENSGYGKLFDNIMYAYNDKPYLEKFCTGEQIDPEQIEMHLSTKCQLNCTFCWGRSSNYKDLGVPGKCYSFKTYCEYIDAFTKNGAKTIMLSGGKEPLKQPYIKAAIDYALKKGLKVHLITNGIDLGNELISSLMSIERIKVSLNAATHETYKVVSGCESKTGEKYFYQVVENIKKLVAEKKKKRSKVRIGLSFVMNEDNYAEAIDFLYLAKDLGVDFVIVNMDYKKKEKDISGDLRKKLTRTAYQIDCLKRTGDFGKCGITLAEALSKLSKKVYSEKLIKPNICEVHRRKIAQDPFSNIYPCCFWVQFSKFWKKEYILGSLQEESYPDILSKNRAFEIYPEKCPSCPDFENYYNMLIAKIKDDAVYGINIWEQPFIGLNDYRNSVSIKKEGLLELLRRIYGKFKMDKFDIYSLKDSLINVSEKSLETLVKIGVVETGDKEIKEYRVAKFFSGNNKIETEANIAAVYNMVINIGGEEYNLGYCDIPDKKTKFVRECIKRKMIHMAASGETALKSKGKKKKIRIWKGYFPLSQRCEFSCIRKKVEEIYDLDFMDKEDLIGFAGMHEYDDDSVLLLPYKMLCLEERDKITKSGICVIFIDISRGFLSDPFASVSIEGLVASGIAYLNNDISRLTRLYQLLTGDYEMTDMAMSRIKADATKIIFELKDMGIFEYEELKYLREKELEYIKSA